MRFSLESSSGTVPSPLPSPVHANGHARKCGPSRVLLVDDEPDVLRGLHNMLVHAGYSVTCATEVNEGVDLLHRATFDLVLTDLYLGDRDLGFPIAEAARARKPRIPVILLTGRPSFDRAQEALASQVSAIVVKPVESQVLIDTCERVIQETELTRRNRELEVANRVMTSVLPRTIEIKDPTTSGHAARVVDYTDNLASRCGVGEEQRASLRMAALLHDIGKIGVPDHILTKPGPLTVDEMEVVKRHPRMGYEVLAELEDHQDVRDWVYHHHERWDGKGYPQGLAGEEVALPGRILVLAEVYDALAEERSYKPAWPVEKIVAFFRDQAGRQFDPDVAHLVADGLERMGKRFFVSKSDMLF
ncbi:MAG: response regulator [Planctomycetes bacterium]|nr:response regulator [Planctomycetota bacterium]